MNQTSILIIEDEGIVAENLKVKLEQLDYKVVGVAAGGEAGIEIALELRPQLVLMDIQLEGPVDGIRAAEAIHAQCDTPIIYLTAHSDPATLARAKITGPIGYILKPFEVRDLATQIELALYKHQADKQVREQREWLSVTLSSIGDAVIATDARGRITFINPVAESLTGWKQEEANGKPVREVFRVINEYTRKEVDDPATKVIQNGNIVGLGNHTILIRRGGGEVPIDDSGAPIIDHKGNIQGVVLVFRDVTERRKTEIAIRDSEKRFRGMIENAPDPIFIQTEQKFAYLNPAACKLFDIQSAEELVGKPVIARIPPDDRHIVEDRGRRIREGLAPDRSMLEHRFLRMDGSPVWVETKGEPIAYEDKNGALVFVRDISQRREAQNALLESESRFRTLAESAPVGIVIADLEEKTLYINQRFTALFGYTIVDMPSVAQWWPLAYPDEAQRSKAQAAWTAALKNATRSIAPFESMDFPVTCKDGSVRDIEFRVTSTGGLLFVLLADVTHRKLAEQAILESSENLRITLHSIGDAVVATDLQGCVTQMNPVAEALTGWTMKEAANRPIEDIFRIVNAQTGAPATNPVKTVLKTNSKVSLANHTKLISKIGKEHQISDLAAPIKDDSGQLLGAVLVFRDVTESYRLREAIQRERHILNLFVEYAPAAIAMFDREMKYISTSRRFLIDYELEGQDIIGRSHYEIFPDIPERWKVIHRRCLAGAVERCDEDPFPRFSGKLDWVRWEIHPWHDMDGSVGGVILFSEVITERKQSEERIRHINQILIAIRSVNQLITYEKDRDTLMRRACKILVETRGYRFAWIVLQDADGKLQGATESGMGEDFIPILNEFERGQEPECYRRAMNSQQKVTAIFSPEDHCGACRWVHKYSDTGVFVGALRHDDHQYGGLMVALPAALGNDPYEQSLFGELVDDLGYALYGLEQQQRRERAEERFRVLFESSSDGILIADIETKQMKYANPAICHFFGYSETEFENLKVDDIHPKAELPAIIANFEKQARGEKAMTSDIPCLKKDGSVFYADINAVPIMVDGRASLAGFFRDITDRKLADQEREKLQAQLIQAQKMESVGRLAGGVAHDYNNILSVIIGYTELALDKIDTSDELYDDLKEIYFAAGRSRDITRQLLAFARKETIAPEVLDLNTTVERLLKMLRRLVGENIDLAWLPETNLGPVLMDPSQIDQILANLCVNARDAIVDVGKITIETGMETIDEAYCNDHMGFKPGDFVCLSISDNGCGMDAVTQANIFEPFFTTKGMGKGTGLGLSTVYGIVKQNNGFINVYSELNEGTTFRIYLPRHAGDISEDQVETKSKIPKGSNEMLLVVEDDASILILAERMLLRLGYRVVTANTPGEALKLAKIHSGEIALLITDVVMPEMNGRELAERIKAHCPHLKSLYMSGYTANVIAHRGVLDKGYLFIQKPFSLKTLADKVKTALRSN